MSKNEEGTTPTNPVHGMQHMLSMDERDIKAGTKIIADMYKMRHDAFVEARFSYEEAFALVLRHGLI